MDDRDQGRFTWRDLVTPDPASAQAFYGDLFGWTFTPSEVEGYSWVKNGDLVVGGLLDARVFKKLPRQAIWLNAVSVEDLGQSLDKAKSAGAKIIREPLDVTGRGRLAVVADPQGALLQFIDGFQPDSVRAAPPVHGWLWTELLADDVAGAVAFYGAALGLASDRKGGDYAVLSIRNEPCAAIVANPFEKTAPVWVPFLRVTNLAAKAAQVVARGGRMVVSPSTEVRNGTVALILDPQGAPLALQEWSPAPTVEGGTP